MRETDILHDMLPHPQPLFLHLHHVVLLVLRVVDLLQLQIHTHTQGLSGGKWQEVGETALLMAPHLLCEECLQLLLVQEVVLIGV